MKINKIIIATFVLLIMLNSAEAYLFRTAAIDGPSYCEDGLYVYINPCTIDVGGVTKTGTPAANFNVNANTVYDVTYSASGYQTDTDDFYFDAGLPTCSGTTCHLTTNQFDTHCTYSSTYDDWTCVVTDTITTQWISFIYNKNDPTWGEVIRILNSMYPVECTTDDECDYLDKDFCFGDILKHKEGICVDYECIVHTTTTQNCNDLDETYCDGTWVKNKDYTCEGTQCVLDSTNPIENCDNGAYCDGQETCYDAQCFAGAPIDCSYNNINGIETCNYCD